MPDAGALPHLQARWHPLPKLGGPMPLLVCSALETLRCGGGRTAQPSCASTTAGTGREGSQQAGSTARLEEGT